MDTFKKIGMASGLVIGLLTGCQSTPKALAVVAKTDNTLQTTGLGRTKTIAKSNALSYAQQQCANKQVVVIKESLHYDGIINPSTGRLVNQSIHIVGALLGKNTPTLAQDDDYEYTLIFDCRSF